MPISRRKFLKRAGAMSAAMAIAQYSPAAPSWLWNPEKEGDDRSADEEYFEKHIRHISDAEVFESLQLDQPALVKVRTLVEKQDYPSAYAAWGNYWSSLAPSRGLYVNSSDLLSPRAEAAASFAPLRDEKLAAAEKVVRHNITGWGTVAIQHGPVVDFNADYGRNGKYGFHYWDWAKPLIAAFLLTDDQKYLAELDALFNAWYEQRDRVEGSLPKLDVIWYELGLGNRNRVFLEYYCLPYEKRSPQTHERMLKTLLGAARWLWREEKRMYRDGNWQIMGSCGLAGIGAIMREFKEASDWVNLGAKRLAEHVEKDFFPDGCHSERVPSSYMLTAYRDPRNVARLIADQPQHEQIAKRLREPLERTLNWYLYALPPDGFIPAINDCSRLKMPAALFDDGARMFGRKDMLAVKDALVQPLAISRPSKATLPEKTSEHFAPSGFTFMRSDWTSGARYMLINHGPFGGGHSHADSLSFQMHAFGIALAIDSGIGYTYDDPNHGPWYKRSKAHNMLMVDDEDLNRRKAEGKDVIWTSLKRLDFFAATHHGYEDSKGIVHRRHIVFVRPDYFLIYDVAKSSGKDNHQLSWNLHLTQEAQPSAGGFASAQSPGLLVLPSSQDWKPELSKGPACVRGIRGFDKDYAEIPWLRLLATIRAGTSSSLGVLLFPFESTRPAVRFRNTSETHFIVEHPAGEDHLLFAPANENDVRFDGACALLRFRDGRLQSWATSQSRLLGVGDRSAIVSTTPRDMEGAQ